MSKQRTLLESERAKTKGGEIEKKNKDPRTKRLIKQESASDRSGKRTALTIQVGKHSVVSRVDLVKDVVENLEVREKEGGKRTREELGKTPEQEKRASKIAVLKHNAKESMTATRGSAGGSLLPLL